MGNVAKSLSSIETLEFCTSYFDVDVAVYSFVLLAPCTAPDSMTYNFSLFKNLLVCEEVQAKEKEMDSTLSLVLSLPEGKCQQFNVLMHKELTFR